MTNQEPGGNSAFDFDPHEPDAPRWFVIAFLAVEAAAMVTLAVVLLTD